LMREKNAGMLNLSRREIEDFLDLLALLAQKQSIYYLLRPNLHDEGDNIFMECAYASNSEYLVTSNIKDFMHSELKGFSFEIITPKDFYKIVR
jgi:predicted nucleic acid-binding protein